ncbi:MAG: sigma-70 family RNA polymerase sigma factor [Actinomycetota bacterium]|nr:sigma-70 family RNA polymerase sigma factor [Actinomycetota bacterium]
MTDQELLARFLDGDATAFEAVMRRHEDRVFAVCLRLLRDREAALEATQETFLTLFRKADRFSGRSALGTWLYRVAVNTCYDQLRRERRQRADPLPVGHDPVDPTASDPFAAVELRPDLERALGALSPEFRAVVTLSDLEGLPLQDVAEVLDLPVGTVKSRLFRARQRLAQHLGNLSGPPTIPSRDSHA